MRKRGLIVADGKNHINLKKIKTADMAGFKNEEEAKASLRKWTKVIAQLQDKLYAQRSYAILITADGKDTAGKSTLAKYILREVNASGKSVTSFKAPSAKELGGDYMRRYEAALPDRGHIGFFDRSHLEEVTTVRVHKEYLKKQNIPADMSPKKIWDSRFEDIRNREQYWYNNGIVEICFYLHLSNQVQKKRLKVRLLNPDKNCKYSEGDIRERTFSPQLQDATGKAINNLSTARTPRIILPADNKWVARARAAEHVAKVMLGLRLHYPVMSKTEQRKQLALLRKS